LSKKGREGERERERERGRERGRERERERERERAFHLYFKSFARLATALKEWERRMFNCSDKKKWSFSIVFSFHFAVIFHSLF
jgi:hypothetical protein